MLALLDTDVILDLVLERTPFVAAAEALVEAHEHGRFSAYIAPITPVNVFYAECYGSQLTSDAG